MVDTIVIVLGNSNQEILKKRVDVAINFYFRNGNTNKNTKFIFTGYNDEGASMAKLASLRIPSNIIFVEPNAKNTYENIINSYNFIKEMKNRVVFNPKIMICTSTNHVKRAFVIANLIFQQPGFKVDFIHTNENVSQIEYQKEMQLLDIFLDHYLNLVEFIE